MGFTEITSSYFASLGGVPLPIHPEGVTWSFEAKTREEHTIGGKVVQVYGMTIKDITLRGRVGGATGVRVGTTGFDLNGDGLIDDERISYYRDNITAQRPDLPTPTPGVKDQIPRVAYRSERAMEDFKKIANEHARLGLNGNPEPLDLILPSLGFGGKTIKVWLVSMNMDGGRSIKHTPGKINYEFSIVLRYAAGDISNVVRRRAGDVILQQIAEGVGYTLNEFNGALTFEETEAALGSLNLGVQDAIVLDALNAFGREASTLYQSQDAGPAPDTDSDEDSGGGGAESIGGAIPGGV